MSTKELVNTEKMPVFIALSILLAILLITLAPEDKTLGAMLKLIYLHGALIVTGLFLFSTALNNPRAISILGIGLAISVWIFMIRIGRILHPENPFRVSESPIQLFYAAITLLFILTSILVAVWMRKKTGCPLELKPE